MSDAEPRIEYVEARRVLLDALEAMRAHLDALVLVGAQAIYLRTQDRLAGYQMVVTRVGTGGFTYTAQAILMSDRRHRRDEPARSRSNRRRGQAGFVAEGATRRASW